MPRLFKILINLLVDTIFFSVEKDIFPKYRGKKVSNFLQNYYEVLYCVKIFLDKSSPIVFLVWQPNEGNQPVQRGRREPRNYRAERDRPSEEAVRIKENQDVKVG